MKIINFFGGEHLKSNKNLTKNIPITQVPLPVQVVIPLLQHTGAVCTALVKEGDRVKTGTKIGATSALITSYVHSSISGLVTKIADYYHPIAGSSPAVFIDSDGLDELDADIKPRSNVDSLSKTDLLEIIKEAGICGLGGAAFPTHVKLNPAKQVDTLIINGAECEPYLTCDYRLMLEKSEDILRGAMVMKKIVGAEAVFVGIEDDKPAAIETVRGVISRLKIPVNVVALRTRYPQGSEKQLIQAITGREVPANKLPFEVAVVVQNAATAFAVYEAVYLGKPLYERIVTLTGRSLREPANLKVRIGTKFCDLIGFCKGSVIPAAKIIMGGPMTGIAQFTDTVPVIKGTCAVLVLSDKEVTQCRQQPCIRCGRCVNVCPMRMFPYAISVSVEAKRPDLAKGFYPCDCVECGLCTYVCPAKRTILEHIRFMKVILR